MTRRFSLYEALCQEGLPLQSMLDGPVLRSTISTITFILPASSPSISGAHGVCRADQRGGV